MATARSKALKKDYSKMTKPEDWKHIKKGDKTFYPYSKHSPAPISVASLYKANTKK